MRGCGGWFRRYDKGVMLRLLKSGRLYPDKMPCRTLREQSIKLRREVKE